MNRLLTLRCSIPRMMGRDEAGGGRHGREQQKNRRARARRLNQFAFACSLVGELHVRGLLAAAAAVVLDLEGDLVALVEGGHAGPLESGGVYEYVLAAVFGLNEAEAARMIEEFHCAVDTSHGNFLSR